MTQVLFSVWSVLVSISDTFLEPLLLGRGTEIPMPIILIGAIGGLLRSSIVGLFVGAVVMTVGYRLFNAYMQQRRSDSIGPLDPSTGTFFRTLSAKTEATGACP